MRKIRNTCIVDDDPLFTFGMKLVLRKAGDFGQLEVYENGQEALDSFRGLLKNEGKLPDVLFLDLNMPIMDGWEFLEDFVKLPESKRSDIAVFIVSSSIDPRDLERIKNYTFVKRYIPKPVTIEDMQKILKEEY